MGQETEEVEGSTFNRTLLILSFGEQCLLNLKMNPKVNKRFIEIRSSTDFLTFLNGFHFA